jgi:hypothetical protein
LASKVIVSKSINLQLLAIGAQAPNLQGLRSYVESVALSTFGHHRSDSRVINLGGCPTLAANQQLGTMVALLVRTADKSIQRFNTVNESGANQEVECPVDCRRRCLLTITAKFIEYVVGLDRFVTTPDDLEYSVSDTGESQTLSPASCLGVLEGFGHTTCVVVPAVLKNVCGWRLVHCLLSDFGNPGSLTLLL